MCGWTDKNSPIPVLVRCFRANKILQILVPLSLAIIALSSYLNVLATNSFSATNTLYSRSKYADGFESFKLSLGIVFTHYFFSQLSEFISKVCSLVVFKAFLCESVNKYTQLDYSEFHMKGSAKIQDNISRSSRAAREVSIALFFEIPKAIIEFIFSFWSIYNLLNPKHFGIFIALFYVCVIFAFFIAFYAYKNDKMNIFLYKKSFTPLADILHNYDIMKAFNKERREARVYSDSLKPFVKRSQSFQACNAMLLFIQKTVLFLPHVYVFYNTSQGVVVWRSGESSLNLQELLEYNSFFNSLKKSVIALRDKVFILIKEMAEMKSDLSFSSKSDISETGLISKKSFDLSIRLRNVDLYAGNNLIQKNQSLIINKGDKIAITGVNGAGKSVFIKTLLKFFKNEGEFYIDDILVENISSKSLRELIAYVPQDPHIFNNTVLYNLGYSQKNIDEKKIHEYCQAFGLHEFFKSMRDGYYTESGEKGKYLSGGQKQRISFMRAVIKDAPIIVMDEPTANIDRTSELDLINKILTLCNDKTFILIVHNHDLLKKFDRILYFTKEGIIGYDSYEQFANRS
ncbi:uncharacterized protein VICG_02061 [Vittaforma corneae ATCC 50505]|uniref:ABC transporter domain-containing protein n=1 Tax=Vittaforma corneae (strain ATCC 50505) TaxID=993615 RepID=L2GJ83_VITCO|nr:uncharacterized protein VICG_02061 [Vittaforma corneae ATCC 50505]ELA40921.1 hypothetical protein VICG_02061 [Vittaforma corneae ATCC 50505]